MRPQGTATPAAIAVTRIKISPLRSASATFLQGKVMGGTSHCLYKEGGGGEDEWTAPLTFDGLGQGVPVRKKTPDHTLGSPLPLLE